MPLVSHLMTVLVLGVGLAGAGCGQGVESVASASPSPPAPLSESDTPSPKPAPKPQGPEGLGVPAPAPTPHVASFDCIELAPLGAVPQRSLDVVETALVDTYAVEVRVRRPVALPKSSFYSPRKRYRAEKLLTFLEDTRDSECDRILGITTKDISTTKGKHEDWGILGLGDLPGTAAVISTFRTKKKVRSVSPDERLARVAIHEVGHTLGLPHCPTHGCLLSDAGGTVATIDHETTLCEVCMGRLRWNGDPPAPRSP